MCLVFVGWGDWLQLQLRTIRASPGLVPTLIYTALLPEAGQMMPSELVPHWSAGKRNGHWISAFPFSLPGWVSVGSLAEGPVEAPALHCQVFPSFESIPDFPGVAL